MSNHKKLENLSALIIDDEEQSHKVLHGLLNLYHPDVEVIAGGYSVKEGLALLEKNDPSILFLDIEMPDGLGFDLLEQVKDPTFHVIFITAFDKYALTAIKFGALDYLLKPIDREELAHSIQKARIRNREQISKEQLKILWDTLKSIEAQKLPTRIAISTLEGIYYKQVEDIIRLEAKHNYTEFTLHNSRKKILASTNLGEYEEQFEFYQTFMRVHRSHLVNLHYVERFVKSDGGYLIMKDGTSVSVSRLYREGLLQQLDRI